MSSTTLFPTAPQDRNGFQIAIFCALPLEAANVQSVFDICWENQGKKYGKIAGDQNSYNTGMIEHHNVVLVHMSSMGGNNAALAAAGLRASFPGIRLALVIGICGAVPIHPVTGQEVVLGDVVISTAVVQYDFGRQYPAGFQRKNQEEDGLSRANPEIRSFVNMLTTPLNRHRFNRKLEQLMHSTKFQSENLAATYPGAVHDRLYESSYAHRHRTDIICGQCSVSAATCSRCCDELECENDKLIIRKRHEDRDIFHAPLVHLGRFGSSNTVMRSGLDRDRLSRVDEIAAFEMEGAGVWEQYPTIIIKAACDYADSHKDKRWQNYAAAVAAGCLKVFLGEWSTPQSQPDQDASFKSIWHVPFNPTSGLTGRDDEFRNLEQRLLQSQGPRIVSLLGLGGIGKTRLAMELAFHIRSQYPNYSVLWVQASDQRTFEQDMLEIGKKLSIPGIEDGKVDVKTLVKQQLSDSEHRWILILDNADDAVIWARRSTSADLAQTSLTEYLPRTTNGSILVTTRSREVASYLTGQEIMQLSDLSPDDAASMFVQRLQNPDLAADRYALYTLLERLACLPLALVQAASYINTTQRPIQTYIDLMVKSDTSVLKLLSKDFGDHSRYHDAVNPVATTWLISFIHIRKYHPLAATYLCRMACFHEKAIPQSLLLDNGSDVDGIDFIDAISVLTGYSFITKQAVIRASSSSSAATEEMYDIHRLVHLSVRGWLKQEGTFDDHIRTCTVRLARIFPTHDLRHRNTWTMYMPHAQRLCGESSGEVSSERCYLLAKMGFCFSAEGNYKAAVNAHTLGLEQSHKFGTLDHHAFDAYHNLGEALSENGEWVRAEHWLRMALHWRQTRLGSDSLDTLRSMSRLAVVLSQQGKYTEAEQMQRQALDARIRALGAEHPDTLRSMNRLAVTLSQQGKYTEAEQMQRQALDARIRALGAEHPDTLRSQSNMAIELSQQSKHCEAEQIQRQVLDARIRALGAEHPDTLRSKANLAVELSFQRRHHEAEQIQRQVLMTQERVLGTRHPETLKSMCNLAISLSWQGMSLEAEKLQVQTVNSSRKILEPQHPHIKKYLDTLWWIRRSQVRHEHETEDMPNDLSGDVTRLGIDTI